MFAVIIPFWIPVPLSSSTFAAELYFGCWKLVPNLGESVTFVPALFGYTMNILDPTMLEPCPIAIHDRAFEPETGPFICMNMSPEPLCALAGGMPTAYEMEGSWVGEYDAISAVTREARWIVSKMNSVAIPGEQSHLEEPSS